MNINFTKVTALPLLLFMTVVCTHAQAEEKVRLLMDWFPQANQSGFWQAQIDSASNPDLDIEVVGGGPRIQVVTQVATGQAEFGLASADNLLLARHNGAPVKAVFVSIDYAPYTLVYHPDQGIKTIEDLSGKTGAVVLGSTYWEWVKQTYKLDTKEIPLTGDLALFANTPDMFQQGYSIFLPARMDEKGIPNEQFKVADLGYRPYSILVTTEEMIKEKPELVATVVEAVQQGWRSFMADPAPTREMLLPLNKGVSGAVHDRSVELMKADFLPADLMKVGCMSSARWIELADQMKSIDALPADFDPASAYDASFLKGC